MTLPTKKRLNLTKKGAIFLEWDECLKWAFGYVTFRWLLLRRMDQTLSKTDYIACYVDIIRGLIMCNDLKGTAHSGQDKFWGFSFFKAYISFWYRKKHMLNAGAGRWWGRWRYWHSGQNWYFGQNINFFVKIDDFIKKSWSFDQIYVFLNLIISSMIDDITPFCSSKV